MNNNKFEKNIKKYAVLVNTGFKTLNLLPDEQIKHCIDTSEDGYYEDGWIITDKGRIWSLTDNRWLVPWMNEKGYWRIANAYVHRWVCHYFMSDEDKLTLKIAEEHNKDCVDSKKWLTEVHHKETIEKVDYSNMTEEEKILACMAVNNKTNLVYQIKNDHTDVHKIMNGKKIKGEEKELGDKSSVRFDSTTSLVRNLHPDTVYFSYDEQGKSTLHMEFNLQGLTPEEDIAYAKENNVIFRHGNW